MYYLPLKLKIYKSRTVKSLSVLAEKQNKTNAYRNKNPSEPIILLQNHFSDLDSPAFDNIGECQYHHTDRKQSEIFDIQPAAVNRALRYNPEVVRTKHGTYDIKGIVYALRSEKNP